jgi:hypothetical protein
MPEPQLTTHQSPHSARGPLRPTTSPKYQSHTSNTHHRVNTPHPPSILIPTEQGDPCVPHKHSTPTHPRHQGKASAQGSPSKADNALPLFAETPTHIPTAASHKTHQQEAPATAQAHSPCIPHKAYMKPSIWMLRNPCVPQNTHQMGPHIGGTWSHSPCVVPQVVKGEGHICIAAEENRLAVVLSAAGTATAAAATEFKQHDPAAAAVQRGSEALQPVCCSVLKHVLPGQCIES